MKSESSESELMRYGAIRDSIRIRWKPDKESFKSCLARLYSMVVNKYVCYKQLPKYIEVDKLVDIVYSNSEIKDKIRNVMYFINSTRCFNEYSEIMSDMIVNNYLIYNHCMRDKSNEKKIG